MGIPEVELNSVGTASFTTALADEVKVMVHAIERGFRHFDTAAHYGSEEAVGKAIAKALKLGLIKSRSEVFVCSKLWASDTHADRVLPAFKKSMQYESAFEYPVADKKNIIPFDCKAVWSVMEEIQRSGLAKSIGVSNFSCKKIEHLLSFATIPPAVNQLELSPVWQQKKLVDFCKSKGIVVTGYATLGSAGQFWGTDRVVGVQALKDIAKAKAKSVPQVILRWAHQHGVATVVKSYNPGRMEENSSIFDWELSDEECKKISEIPQSRGTKAEGFVSEEGAIKSVEDLWDGEL
ncbi:hypothetical protein ACS0TY_025986 [Phlomoides rotata]